MSAPTQPQMIWNWLICEGSTPTEGEECEKTMPKSWWISIASWRPRFLTSKSTWHLKIPCSHGWTAIRHISCQVSWHFQYSSLHTWQNVWNTFLQFQKMTSWTLAEQTSWRFACWILLEYHIHKWVNKCHHKLGPRCTGKNKINKMEVPLRVSYGCFSL